MRKGEYHHESRIEQSTGKPKRRRIATTEMDHDHSFVDRSGTPRPSLSLRREHEADPASRDDDSTDAAAGAVLAVHRRGRGSRRAWPDPAWTLVLYSIRSCNPLTPF